MAGLKMHALKREAKIEILGVDDVKNEPQRKVLNAIISAFGDSAKGFIYVEPCTARSTRRPADVLLCHPEVGLLIIEVKGYSINQIENIKAGNLLVKAQGSIKPINPYRQAEDAMFDIQDAIRRKIRSKNGAPLFMYMVALPEIDSIELHEKNFHESLPYNELLLKDEIQDLEKLKYKISRMVEDTLERSHKADPLTISHIEIIKGVFGDSAALIEHKDLKREVRENSLGEYIDELAYRDKNLSNEQQELSRLPIKGFPRLIRGVAGSGKTIVLANMAARYISREINSETLFKQYYNAPKIAAICFNRSLVEFLKNKINTAYQQQTFQDLPERVLTVRHLNGLLYKLSGDDTIRYVRKDEGSAIFRANKYIADLDHLMNNSPESYNALLFDAIFVDEGQDLAPEEYKLLKKLVRKDPSTGEPNLIIFYDDAQNLYAKKRPKWKELGIDLGKGDRTRIMKECFRNTKEIVNLGFNVLVGKQAPNSEAIKNRTYADLQTLKQHNLITEDENIINVKFADRGDMKPWITIYRTREEEKNEISKQILDLIYNHSVRPEDILVLFTSEKEFLDLDEIIKARDSENRIEGYKKPFKRYPDKDTYIFKKNHLTISTIHGAKGYDAYIVFYLGAESCETDESGRAAFYVAATRV